jgi:hypothetical protein
MRVHSPISINFSSSTKGSSVKLRGKGFASGVPLAGRAQVANTRLVPISEGLVSGVPIAGSAQVANTRLVPISEGLVSGTLLPGSVHAATVRLAARSQPSLARFNSHISLLLYGLITDLSRRGASQKINFHAENIFHSFYTFFTSLLLL